jgi:ubiquinone/menaquinone biosynthesis C-methylase UbiE
LRFFAFYGANVKKTLFNIFMMNFEKQYFDQIYAKDETIDGDYNSRDHAHYLYGLFRVMGIHVSSIYDFGFGKGTLLRDVSKKLEAVHIGGCDISNYAYTQLKKKPWAQDYKLHVSEIYNLKIPRKPYHLGLCNSVLQYVPDKHLKKTIHILAKSCKYVYLHVPTLEDYKLLKKDLNFHDPYAIQRKSKLYEKLLGEEFYFVSWGLLESKAFTKYSSSPFCDSIYRF